jgi:hypothetical protein
MSKNIWNEKLGELAISEIVEQCYLELDLMGYGTPSVRLALERLAVRMQAEWKKHETKSL